MYKNSKLQCDVAILGMSATGLSVARSLGRKGVRVFGIDCNRLNPGMLSRYVKPCCSPDTVKDEAVFINYLISFAKARPRPLILMCAHDEYVVAVSRNRDVLAPYFKFNIPSKEIVEDFLDKRRSNDIARMCGLECPATYFAENEYEVGQIIEKVKFPCALKPAISHLWKGKFGGKKLFLINSKDELLIKFREIRRVYSEIMVQDLISGKDDQIYAFCTYFDKNSEPLAIFTKRKLRQHPIHFGISSFSFSEVEPVVLEKGLEFFKKLKYSGFGALELKRDAEDNRFKFTELNMRFLMTGELAIASGIDFPYIMYRDLAGENQKFISNFKENVKLVNLELDLGSFYQYRKVKEIGLFEYIRSFIGGKLVHTYFSYDDLKPFLFAYLKFMKSLFKKIFIRQRKSI
jgi:predicted ATP-grasp superfamily ATP-dependent carboligase